MCTKSLWVVWVVVQIISTTPGWSINDITNFLTPPLLYHHFMYYIFVIKFFLNFITKCPSPQKKFKNGDVIYGRPNLGSGSSVVSEWPSQPALHLAQAKPKYTKQDQGIFGAKVKPVFSGWDVCMWKTFILRIFIRINLIAE